MSGDVGRWACMRAIDAHTGRETITTFAVLVSGNGAEPLVVSTGEPDYQGVLSLNTFQRGERYAKGKPGSGVPVISRESVYVISAEHHATLKRCGAVVAGNGALYMVPSS